MLVGSNVGQMFLLNRAETVIGRFDACAGGGWQLEMRMGARVGHQRAEFTVFEPPARLTFLQYVLDADGNVASDPNNPDWPRRLLTEVTLTHADGGTDLRLVWTPHQCSEAEIACFAQSIGWLGKGWGAGMDVLATILEELAAA